MKKQYRVLQTLCVAIHLGKTFIGKVKKGFNFLGFHLTPTGVTVSKAALSRHEQKVARLYEQDAKPKRIRAYRLRWLVWALIGAGTPGLADVTVVAHTGLAATDPSTSVNRVVPPGGTLISGIPTFAQSSITSDFYNDPSSSIVDFGVYLPGSTYASTISTSAKVNLENSTNNDLVPGNTSVCAGAITATVNSTTASFDIVLAPGSSCSLSVYWANAGNPISFTGATLSRAADGVYSIDGNGVIRGEDAGGTADTPPTPSAAQNIPIFGPFGLLAMLLGLLGFGHFYRKS